MIYSMGFYIPLLVSKITVAGGSDNRLGSLTRTSSPPYYHHPSNLNGLLDLSPK